MRAARAAGRPRRAAEALLRVLEDGALREQLAECGRRRARERFSLSAMIEAMENRYREARSVIAGVVPAAGTRAEAARADRGLEGARAGAAAAR